MKNKKIIIGIGAALVLVAGYFLLAKKETVKAAQPDQPEPSGPKAPKKTNIPDTTVRTVRLDTPIVEYTPPRTGIEIAPELTPEYNPGYISPMRTVTASNIRGELNITYS